MGLADREHLCVDFNLVAMKNWSPVYRLCSENYWLLIFSVFYNCEVQGLVELEEDGCIDL